MNAADLFINLTGYPLVPGSRWVDLAAFPDASLTRDTAKTWGELLKGSDIPITTVEDPGGNPRQLVQRLLAIAAVNEASIRDKQKSPFHHAHRHSQRPAIHKY